jgi:hypothetical protein
MLEYYIRKVCGNQEGLYLSGTLHLWSILVIVIYWVIHIFHNLSRNNIKEVGEGEKGRVVPVNTMKAYSGSRGIASLILNHDTKWR